MISADVKIDKNAFNIMEQKVLELLEKTALEAETTMKDSITQGSKVALFIEETIKNIEHQHPVKHQRMILAN